MSATLDGRSVDVQPGDTILDTAVRAGIVIPTLCHVPGLAPEAACRLCLVEVGDDGRLLAACHSPMPAEGQVRTATPRLEALRRDLLGLVARAHSGGQSGSFGALLQRSGVSAPGPAAPVTGANVTGANVTGANVTAATVTATPVDASHPYLRLDLDRCIVCLRCVHACEEIQGQFVFSGAGRGDATHLIFGPSDRFADSPCVACGACVDLCPTGAITDRDRLNGAAATQVTRSTCGYCGVGCQVQIETDGAHVLRIHGTPEASVNRGHLCAKGRYAHAHHHSPERLTTPLLRDGDGFRAIGWDEALTLAATRLRAVRDSHGPGALGLLTSSRSTNEAAYLLQKLFRTVLATNNVDCCARVCHSSTALALQRLTGTGAATAAYADIERAARIFVCGANATEAHPVIGARIKQAVLRGARLVVVDPRRIELADFAELHLPLRPGTNVQLFNALGKLLLEADGIDHPYVEQQLEGFETWSAALRAASLAELAAQCGVAETDLRAAAAVLAQGPTLFVHGLGLSELVAGVASVMALANLGMVTGSIGRPGAGMLPLRGQNNVQGNADMGAMPNQLTGYQAVTDPEVRAHAAAIWGQPPPEQPGLTVTEMLDAAVRGEVRALWIQGEDVAQSDPHESRTLAALQQLDFLVVQELFLSETARYAHLVLPAAGVFEQDGTFTNAERRIQRVRAAVPPPGLARADWQVAVQLAQALGAPWQYDTPAEVMAEIARVAPEAFGGVTYPRLEADGLQWPCPTLEHPGTATVHADGFLRGRGLLFAVTPAPNPEAGVPGFAYLLITGRILHQYNVGTMTRRTPQLELAPADVLELHPADAAREGLHDGDRTTVVSRWGRAQVPVRTTTRVLPGTLFLTFHHPETHANRLTGPYVDPDSKCPQYKVTAVRLDRST